MTVNQKNVRLGTEHVGEGIFVGTGILFFRKKVVASGKTT